MNIFKSKEIYKRIPGVSPELNPLRKARGVYVSGEYLPPFYIDAGAHINSISSNKTTIIDYTNVNVNFEDHDGVLKFTGIYSSDFNIKTYYEKTYNTNADNMLKFTGIYSSDFEIMDYTSITYNTEADNMLKFTGFYTTDYVVKTRYQEKQNTQPEPGLHLLSIESNASSISNF